MSATYSETVARIAADQSHAIQDKFVLENGRSEAEATIFVVTAYDNKINAAIYWHYVSPIPIVQAKIVEANNPNRIAFITSERTTDTRLAFKDVRTPADKKKMASVDLRLHVQFKDEEWQASQRVFRVRNQRTLCANRLSARRATLEKALAKVEWQPKKLKPKSRDSLNQFIELRRQRKAKKLKLKPDADRLLNDVIKLLKLRKVIEEDDADMDVDGETHTIEPTALETTAANSLSPTLPAFEPHLLPQLDGPIVDCFDYSTDCSFEMHNINVDITKEMIDSLVDVSLEELLKMPAVPSA